MQIYYKSLIFLYQSLMFSQFYPSMQINYKFKFHLCPNSFNFWFCFRLFNFITINVWIYFNFVLQIIVIIYVFFFILTLILLIPLFFWIYFCPYLYIHAISLCFQFFFIYDVIKFFYLMFKF